MHPPSFSPERPDPRNEPPKDGLREIERRHSVLAVLDGPSHIRVRHASLPLVVGEVGGLEHGSHLPIATARRTVACRALLTPSEIDELSDVALCRVALGRASGPARSLLGELVVVVRVMVARRPLAEGIGRRGAIACARREPGQCRDSSPEGDRHASHRSGTAVHGRET